MNKRASLIATGLLLVVFGIGVFAQEISTDSVNELKAVSEESTENSKATPKPSPTPKPDSECLLCRWVDLQTATISTRYRWVRSNQAVTPAMLKTQPFLKVGEYITISQNQQQQLYEFDFKFDKEGRYKIHTRLSSGDYFTRSFAETGWGDPFNGEQGWAVRPRQFYLSLEPVKGIEIQYGGLGINRGENTENTTYDNDGYITGQRVSFKRPDKLWFNEISVTYAYFGDLYTPNFFRRAKHLSKSNYHQYLVGKKFGKRVGVSMDYTSQDTISHLREGISIKTPELKVFDSIRVEAYHRLEDYRGVKKASGYNIQVEKTLFNRLYLLGGVADTDYRYNVLTMEKFPARQAQYIQPAGSLTADRMIRGMSPFLQWKYQITPLFSVFGFMTADVNKPPLPRPFVYNADHFSIGFQFDVKQALNKTRLF